MNYQTKFLGDYFLKCEKDVYIKNDRNNKYNLIIFSMTPMCTCKLMGIPWNLISELVLRSKGDEKV
jgi:hypothetical protein